jgi:hypothetical protein
MTNGTIPYKDSTFKTDFGFGYNDFYRTTGPKIFDEENLQGIAVKSKINEGNLHGIAVKGKIAGAGAGDGAGGRDLTVINNQKPNSGVYYGGVKGDGEG